MTFLDNINIGQYVPTDSVVHRLDPRTKILIILGIMILTVATTDLLIYAWIALFLIFFAAISQIPLPYFFRNIKSFFWLFLLTFLLHIFFPPRDSIKYVDLGLVRINQLGLLNGLVYSIRLGIFIFSAALLSLTTQAVELTDAVFKSFAPLKKIRFPVEELSLITMISLRFIPLLLEEAVTLKKAQMSRGATFEGGLIKRTKKSLPLLVPLFISSFRRADELALALDARGFRSGQERTSFRVLSLKTSDYVFLFIFLLMLGISLWFKTI
jgi:energy-coupling factor transport system permease protein